LIQGSPSGHFYDRVITEVAKPIYYDGSQTVENYSLLIINASEHNTSKLASDELLIDEAIKLGVPVLLFNVSDDAVKNGLSKHISASLSGNNIAYLIHNHTDGNDASHVSVISFPQLNTLTPLEINNPGDMTADGQAPQVNSSDTEPNTAVDQNIVLEHYINRLKSFLDTRDLNSGFADSNESQSDTSKLYLRDSAPEFDVSTPPNYAVFRRASTHTMANATLETVQNGKKSSANEQLSVTIETYIFYDEIAQEYRVFLTQQGTAYMDSDNNYSNLGIIIPMRWFQLGMYSTVDAQNSGAYALDFSPKNVSSSESYTDSTSTTVGVSVSEHPSASASYTVSHSVTKTIYDWTINNTSSNAQSTQWHYFQTSNDAVKYDDLPSLSRFNFSFSNTSLWSIPNTETQAKFKVSFIRDFSVAFLGGSISGSSGTASKFKSEPFEIIVDLPTHN
jgi:hypothetical protein